MTMAPNKEKAANTIKAFLTRTQITCHQQNFIVNSKLTMTTTNIHKLI